MRGKETVPLNRKFIRQYTARTIPHEKEDRKHIGPYFCCWHVYKSDRQAKAVDEENSGGNGRIFVGISDGCVVTVKSTLEGLADYFEK